MKFNNQNQYSYSAKAEYNQGLRSFMLQVYNYMGIGLLITAMIAMFAGNSPEFMNSIITPRGLSGLGWLIALAPLGFVIFLQAGIQKMSLSTAQMVFFGYSTVMGLSLSTLFVAYTGESIARVFFITAATFGATSMYGYVTKRDLSKMGSFLIMGLFGIIIASLVNMFLKSSGLHFVVSLIGVVVFTGLIAFETQNLKNMYFALTENHESAGKIALLGALSLYINFINLFTTLLQFLGDRKNN